MSASMKMVRAVVVVATAVLAILCLNNATGTAATRAMWPLATVASTGLLALAIGSFARADPPEED